MTYEIVNGRIKTRSLEVHIVDHCNLRCDGCCSLSPFLPQWFIEPEELQRDLRLAGRVLAPTWFKLVGGEPLLHPELIECLRIAKDAQIAEIVSVTTNGFLLDRMPEEFWVLADAMTISLYPRPALPRSVVELINAKALAFGVELNWKRQDMFVDMDRDRPAKDPRVTQAVWDDCWLRHRCHLLSKGRFYACTRPAHFETYFRPPRSFTGDGVELDDRPGLVHEIHEYLIRNEPLDACAWCRGGDAELKPHRQLTVQEVRAVLVRIADEVEAARTG